VHDRGGWPTDAPIDRIDHVLADWELLTDALVDALGNVGVMNVDELRRAIESMPPEAYETASYYERWLFAIETILTEKGVLVPGEIDARLAARRGPSPRRSSPNARLPEGQDRPRGARASHRHQPGNTRVRR
jgi:nitrile hydratase subunit beta